MKVETFNFNSKEELASNTYVIYNEKKEAFVVDPSTDYDGIINFLIENKLKLKFVLLTHCHFDHIKGVDRLINRFKVPFYCHFDEEELLTNPKLNCSNDFNKLIIISAKPSLLADNEIIKFGKEKIRVIHTPFHTKGSVCYFLENNKLLFSGDTLFKLTVGRDDLPTSIPSLKAASLAKLKTLPSETKIYPGHGLSTDLSHELTFNRFFNR